MDTTQKLLTDIKSILSSGLDNSGIIIAEAGDSFTSDELDRSFSVYAPFGDVDITSMSFDYGTLGTNTVLGGSQIFGRLTELTIASGSNPLLIYVKK
jgi:hypothetical protein